MYATTRKTVKEQSKHAPIGAAIKKAGNNRAFWQHGNDSGFILHRTNVVLVKQGRLYVGSGWWETPTTRQAIHDGIAAMRRAGYALTFKGNENILLFIEKGRLFWGTKRLDGSKPLFVGYAKKTKG